MATKWYAAHSIDTADDSAIQHVPSPGDYTDLNNEDYCLTELSGTLSIYKYNSTSSETQVLGRIITPDGNTGNGRWILERVLSNASNGFDVAQGPPTDSTLSWDDGTRTMTITPTGTSFDYFIDGVKYTQTGAASAVITDVEGLHVIYFDDDGTLTVGAPGASIDTVILTKCIVSYVYWNATDNVAVGVGEERHGNSMSPITHLYLHDSFGARYESGLGLSGFDIDGSGNDASAAQFDVEDGKYHDEDIEIEIVDNVIQSLTPATIPTLYRLGAGGAWRKLTPTADFPIADGTVGVTLDWNEFTGGAWQLSSVTTGKYVLTHYFAVNGILGSIVGFMGLGEYTSRLTARAAAETEINSLVLAGLPGPEFIPIATTIWQTATTYSNQVAARLISTDTGDDYVDWRSSSITGVGGAVSDHESLSGLLGGAVGDHYHLTGVQETDLTDGGESTLHYHNALKDSGQIGAVYTTGAAMELNYNGVKALATGSSGVRMYKASNSLVIYDDTTEWTILNENVSQHLFLKGTNSASATKSLFSGDPDDSVKLYFKGVKSLETANSGVDIFDDDGDDPIVSFYSSAAVRQGYLRFNNGTEFLVYDSINSKNVIVGNLGGSVDLYNNGTKSLETKATGVKVYDSAARAAYLGFVGVNDNIFLRGDVVSGHLILQAKDAASAYVKLFEGDPDGTADLYHDGTKALETSAAGVKVIGINTTPVYIQFYSDTGFSRGSISFDNATGLNMVGSSSQNFFYGAIGAETNLYYDSIKTFSTSATGCSIFDSSGNDPYLGFYGGDFIENGYIQFTDAGLMKLIQAIDSHYYVKGNPNAAVELYYDGVKSFGTLGTGIEVFDASGVSTWRVYDFNPDIRIQAMKNSAKLVYWGLTSVGGYSQMASMDPDGAVGLYHAGVVSVLTANNGMTLYNAGVASQQFFVSGGNAFLDSVIANSNVYIRSRNAADSALNVILLGDPDGSVGLYHAGVKSLETTVNGMSIDGVRPIDFQCGTSGGYMTIKAPATGHSLSYRFIGSAGSLLGALWAVGSSDTLTHMNIGKLYNDYSARFYMDGAVELYYDGVKAFATTAESSGGVVVYGDIGQNVVHKFSTSDHYITNTTVSGDVFLRATNSVSTPVVLFNGDPDGSADLYYAGVKSMYTRTGGIYIADSSSNLASFYISGASGTFIKSYTHGAPVTIIGEDAAGNSDTIFKGDPDAAVELYHAGVKKLYTAADGFVMTDISGADQFRIYDSGGEITLATMQNSEYIRIRGLDLSGNDDLMFQATPDGAAELYYAGVKALETNSGGVTVQDTSGANPIISLTNDTGTILARIIVTAGSPEGVIASAPGSIALNSSGGAGVSIYVKESGTGATGWVAK